MDKKYMHASFKLVDNFFKRSFSFNGNGSTFSSYRFAEDVPYVANRTVANDEVVYDYGCLLEYTEGTEIAKDKFAVDQYNMRDINVAKFEEIMHRNINVIGHCIELKKEFDILSELGAL